MERRWREAEAACRETILESLTPDPSAVLLDVGCDDGAWTEQLRRRLAIPAGNVHGLEFVDDRAEAARGRGFDVQTADIEESWPAPSGAFDVVHANQVIEHVKRLDHFVGEVRRVLAPGGRAVVCTENLASWHNVAALALGYQPFSLTNISSVRPVGNPFALHADQRPGPESWQHVHVLTLAALCDLFEAHGLPVVASWGRGYYVAPRVLAAPLARADTGHAHFIAVIASAPNGQEPARLRST
jgi:SAM-dependent methyltransferase